MVEPEKPFACTMPDCGMTFTNEDHLHVHTKKHDMVLQFGCEQKAAFVADQTPTPTRFIRNCEEVGLFQDLQNVNPFDEGFKRAMETKQGILSLENAIATSTEDLHTPQMFPLLDPGDSVFSATNNQRNITISRSSSDETGAIKEFETTTISKLTNEVTTISRIVEKHEDLPKSKDTMKNSMSFTNNIIKIHSNVEIRKDTDRPIEDTVIKDAMISKDVYDRLQVEVPPIMSQKSIDFVVESLTADLCNQMPTETRTIKNNKTDNASTKESKNVNIKEGTNVKEVTKSVKEDVKSGKEGKDYEVILKLPSGQQLKLISADEVKEKPKNAKDLLKKVLTEKVESQKAHSVNIVPNIVPAISSGTLIPVSIINTAYIPKLPLKVFDKRPVKRKLVEKSIKQAESKRRDDKNGTDLCYDANSRSAASRRYRARLKETMIRQAHENKQLKELNERLIAEKTALKELIIEHVKRCHNTDDLRDLQTKICNLD